MNKQIRLLLENLFDDLHDIEDNKNLDTEFSDKYLTYKVGDVFYQNKKPYAICCGNNENFKDNNSRFMLLNFQLNNLLQWSTAFISKIITNAFKLEHEFFLRSFNDFRYIDENGYENTQIVKNNYNISKFPAFDYCIKFGDNVYLPAIDELQIMYLNINNIKNEQFISILNTKGCENTKYAAWSSTQNIYNTVMCIYNMGPKIIISPYGYVRNYGIIYPFVKI